MEKEREACGLISELIEVVLVIGFILILWAIGSVPLRHPEAAFDSYTSVVLE